MAAAIDEVPQAETSGDVGKRTGKSSIRDVASRIMAYRKKVGAIGASYFEALIDAGCFLISDEEWYLKDHHKGKAAFTDECIKNGLTLNEVNALKVFGKCQSNFRNALSEVEEVRCISLTGWRILCTSSRKLEEDEQVAILVRGMTECRTEADLKALAKEVRPEKPKSEDQIKAFNRKRREAEAMKSMSEVLKKAAEVTGKSFEEVVMEAIAAIAKLNEAPKKPKPNRRAKASKDFEPTPGA